MPVRATTTTGGATGSAGKSVRTKDIPEFGKAPKKAKTGNAGKAGSGNAGKAGKVGAGPGKAGGGKGALRGATRAAGYALAAKPLARNTRDLARSVREVDARGAASAGAKLGLTVATLKARWGIVTVAAIGAVVVVILVLIVGVGAMIGMSGMGATPAVLAGASAEVETWSTAAMADIPDAIRQLYEEAVDQHCPTLPATFVGAIGKIESNHGRHPLVQAGQANSAGARGVMQILPGTWDAHKWDGNGDGVLDPNDAADSIHTGVRILCDYWRIVDPAMSTTSLWALAYAYNHGPHVRTPPRTEEAAIEQCGGPPTHVPGDDCYVKNVLDMYSTYRMVPLSPGGAVDPSQVPDPRVRTVIQYARDQVGKRYVWGTRGPNTFDCSGLAQAAYRQIGLEIGWNTADQFLNPRNRERNHLVAGSQGIRTMVTLRQILQPGDLIYIGVDNSGGDGVSDHVVMYVGENTAYPVGDRRRYEIVHASSPSRGVVKDPLYLPAIVSGVLRPAAGLPPAG